MKAIFVQQIIDTFEGNDEIREVTITMKSGKEIIFNPQMNSYYFLEAESEDDTNIIVLEGNQNRFIDCDEIAMIDY
jgi:hypothetical protein